MLADDRETNVLKVNTSKHGLHFTFCYFVLKYSVGSVYVSTQLIITLLQMFIVFPLLIYSNCKCLCFQFSTLAQWNPPLKNTTNTQQRGSQISSKMDLKKRMATPNTVQKFVWRDYSKHLQAHTGTHTQIHTLYTIYNNR